MGGQAGDVVFGPGRSAWLRPIVVTSALVLVGWLVLLPTGAGELPIDGVIGREWTGPAAALACIALLSLDVALPVPSTIVLLAAGARFGAVGGSAIAVTGLVAATLTGYVAGLGLASIGPARRAVGADAATDRAPVGPWWVAATRGVPVLSEATAIAAGATGASLRPVAVAALAGALPVGVVYAIAGERVGEGEAVGFVVAALVLVAHAAVILDRKQRFTTKRSTP